MRRVLNDAVRPATGAIFVAVALKISAVVTLANLDGIEIVFGWQFGFVPELTIVAPDPVFAALVTKSSAVMVAGTAIRLIPMAVRSQPLPLALGRVLGLVVAVETLSLEALRRIGGHPLLVGDGVMVALLAGATGMGLAVVALARAHDVAPEPMAVAAGRARVLRRAGREAVATAGGDPFGAVVPPAPLVSDEPIVVRSEPAVPVGGPDEIDLRPGDPDHLTVLEKDVEVVEDTVPVLVEDVEVVEDTVPVLDHSDAESGADHVGAAETLDTPDTSEAEVLAELERWFSAQPPEVIDDAIETDEPIVLGADPWDDLYESAPVVASTEDPEPPVLEAAVEPPGTESSAPLDAPDVGEAAPAFGAPLVPAALDLNEARAEDLVHLPGVGPALASRIVTFRKFAGPFTSEEDLTSVPGIGNATVERLRSLVTV